LLASVQTRPGGNSETGNLVCPYVVRCAIEIGARFTTTGSGSRCSRAYVLFEIAILTKEILHLEDNPKLSRRSILKGAALLAGGTLIAGVMASKEALAQKAAKGSMQYRDRPNEDKQCSNCAQFIPNNGCQIVEGTVSPQGYCIAWQKKP
jgi:hypothetical protein